MTGSAHHLRLAPGERRLAVTPEEAGWQYLDFALQRLDVGETMELSTPGRELALVPIEGSVEAEVEGRRFSLERESVFSDPPHVLYVPPGATLRLRATRPATVTLGGAPAEGRYPLRLFTPDDMRVEIRGGGAAVRQVNHLLSAPLPAERLILYEIVAPRGAWCGWPPHCHDGRDGSPYLEEVYWFSFERAEGYAHHRNYRHDEDFDENFIAADGDLVLVTKGYHTTVASPGSHMYFLNYLAGELTDDERARPPCFDPDHAWIAADWGAGAISLPTPSAAGTPAR